MAITKKSKVKTAFGTVPDKLKGFGGGLPRAMGVKITLASKKKIVAELPVKPIVLNRNGRANGGALMAFADCIGAAGTVMNLPDGYVTTTLESKTNFLGAGVGPVLQAVSIPLHVGKTTMVWQTTISNSGDGSRVAIITQTQIVIPLRK
ncbi:MAG TPA: PaaI family thioesterase [Burkholderiales bacterium]|nr:PaaI family thioesterase [Burkholderiales bacterium]